MHYSFSLSYYLWLLNASDPPSTEGKVWICRRLRDELRFFLDLRESCIRIESFLVWRRSYLCASLYYIQPPSLQRPTRTLCNLLNTCGKLKINVIFSLHQKMVFFQWMLNNTETHNIMRQWTLETLDIVRDFGTVIPTWDVFTKPFPSRLRDLCGRGGRMVTRSRM